MQRKEVNMKRAAGVVLLLAIVWVAATAGCRRGTPSPSPVPTVAPAPTLTPAAATVAWQLFTDEDYVGPVQRAAVVEGGQAVYLATLAALYRVDDMGVQLAAERPEEEARLVLAPGGEVYAWLIPQVEWQGLFYIRLMDMSGRQFAELQLDEFPYGFGTLYLGFQGQLILTASPLEDWEGVSGQFLYAFWNLDGQRLADVVLPRQLGFPDPNGTAILLLGQEEALAFSSSGEELWRLSGQYRAAALAQDGNLALLNPEATAAIDEVHIFSGGGEPTVVQIATPVHDMILVPDGSRALIVGDQGRYWYLQPLSADLQEAPLLPYDGRFYISDAEFLTQDWVTLSGLHREGELPNHTWPSGTILVLDQAGNTAFEQTFDIREPLAHIPAIDVTLGQTLFAGYTEDTIILVDLGGR
jgi:hypothetical protein